MTAPDLSPPTTPAVDPRLAALADDLKTRTRVDHYGLTPPPARGRRRYMPADVDRLMWVYPRDLAPVREIEYTRLRATQPSVRNSSIRRHMARAQPGYYGDLHPLVVRWDGKEWLFDGHHRTCVALASGATHGTVNYMDLDDAVIRALLEIHAGIEAAAHAAHAHRLVDIAREHGPLFPLPSAAPAAREAFHASLDLVRDKTTTANRKLRVALRAHLDRQDDAGAPVGFLAVSTPPAL